MALKFRRGTTAQKSGSLAFGEPYVNTSLGTLQIGGQSGDITLLINSSSAGISGSSLDITGNAKIDGNLSLGGQLTIGDATSDTLNVVASLSSSLIPSETNVFDLGSATKIWRDLYISTGSIKLVNPSNNTVVSTISTNADGTTSFDGLVRANQGIFIPNSVQVTGTGGLGIGAYGDRLMLGTSGSAGIGQQSLIFADTNTHAYTFPAADGTIALTSDLTSGTNSVSALNAFTSSINTTIKNKLDVESVISGSSQLTSSYDNRYVTLDDTQTINGTKTFNDIVVNGTGSFAYITSVSGNAKIIGDSFIVVNTDTPTSRYAGISVYDSGSTLSTASFYYDGETNDWGYEYSASAGIDYAVVMFGPEYTTKGNPTYLTTNKIPKAVDNHHLNDSNISDNGTTITLGSNTVVTGTIVASGTTLVSGSSQITAGSTTNFATDVKTQLNSNTVISGSSQVQLGSASGNIALSTQTTGDYVSSLVAGTGITLSNNSGEGATPTIAIGQVVATSSSPTFAGLTINGAITATGDITAYYTSDKRHKNNIQIIPNALEKVSKLNGVTWEWNDDVNEVTKSTPKTGLIAQEVQEVLPEVVTERQDGFLALDYSKMMGLMVEAIKEQQTQIHNLTLQIEELKKQKGL